MSTEGTDQPAPRTRAEMRALREAQEAAALAAEVPEAPEPVRGAGAVPWTGDSVHSPSPREERGDESKRPGVESDAATTDSEAHRVSSRSARGATGEVAATRRSGRFTLTIAAVVAVLALVGGALAVFSLTQGPRLSEVQVDPAEAIVLSGSRVILTANQPLEAIDAEQVTVTPEIPFTVDATGRNVGVRFTVPLDDATEYTVTVAGVSGIGGGPASDLTTTFTTPASEVFLLQRSAGDDTIFRTELRGDQAVPVFTHERINDFRETGDQLVVVVEEGDASKVLVIGKDGSESRELALPGDGYVSAVQVSDRGSLVGFVYSDRDLTEVTGWASVLVTQPLSGEGEPSIVEVGEEPANVAEWQFVPDTASVIFIDFSGTLFVADRATGADPSPMGTALSIQGVERGTYTAIIQRADGSLFRLDLADGAEMEFPASDPDYGVPVAIAPFPGGTTQHIIARDDIGMPIGQAIVRVDDDGAATPLLEVGEADSILQACPSPSGQYVAISVAPDLLNNDYDDMLLPLPERVETHLLDLRTGELLVALSGVDISWCTFGPEQ